MKMDKTLIGGLMCLIAVLSWGGMFPVMGDALKILDAFYFTLFRYISATIVFVVLLAIIEGKSQLNAEGHKLSIWFYGTMGFAGFSFLVFLGQKLAGPSGAVIAAVMMAVQPLLGVLVNWVTKKAVPKPLNIVFMLTALIGVVMVISKGDLTVFFSKDSNLFADLLILIGALCWVIYTSGGSLFPQWSPLRYTTLTSIYGSISIVLIVGAATLMGWLKIPTISMISAVSPALFYMIFIAGVLAVFVWNIGNRAITPINGILFMNMVPVTTFVISTIRGYHITSYELIGALIAIFSLVGNNLYIRNQSKLQAKTVKIETA